MQIEGVEYRFQVASDLQRDGLGLECYRQPSAGEELVLEVFRNDSKHEYTVSQFSQDLPLAFVEHVATVARFKLGGFAP
jgi:hypothetical protein